MDISILPQELVEAVANYLSLNDILSCCLVNSTWRRIFNDDRIWFNLCSKRSPVQFDKFTLIKEPCSVVPRFEFFNRKCSVLEPVCQWRERFMQEAHLTRNWRQGRHSEHLIIDRLEDRRDDHYNFSNVQCEGNLILVPYSEKLKFYVYNTRESLCLTQIIGYSLNHIMEYVFQLSNNRLIIVQCNLLQIYEISVDDEYVSLSHIFLFDKPQNASLNIPKENTSFWYEKNVGLYPCDTSIASGFNGQYFIGIIYDGPIKKPHFHIWDVQKGCKIGVEYLPCIKFLVQSISLTIYKMNLFILVQDSMFSSSNTVIYRYNLNNFQFSPSTVEFNFSLPWVSFSDKYIINVDLKCDSLYFWDHNSGELVFNLPCSNRLNLLSTSVINNYLIYAEILDLSSIVKVVPLNDLNSFSEIYVSFSVRNVSLVRDGMILVSSQMGLLLLDQSDSSVLAIREHHECVWSNPSSSKIVTVSPDGLCLLNFW